jgi:hypothetical protein
MALRVVNPVRARSFLVRPVNLRQFSIQWNRLNERHTAGLWSDNLRDRSFVSEIAAAETRLPSSRMTHRSYQVEN